MKAQSGLNVTISSPESVAPQMDALTTTSSSSRPQLNNGDLQELALYQSSSAGGHDSGTQSKPIELCDDASSKLESQAQGDFLMEDLPEPENLIISNTNPNSSEETQVTLSDATFESQPLNVLPEEHEVQVQHRKQAYKAVRDFNGAWAEDHGLVSSGGYHGEEEVEL